MLNMNKPQKVFWWSVGIISLVFFVYTGWFLVINAQNKESSSTKKPNVLDIKGGPGPNHKTIGKFYGVDDVVITHNVLNGWVKLTGGGWVDKKLLKETQLKEPRTVLYCGVFGLDIKEKPGKDYKTVGRIYEFDAVTVQEDLNGWVRIKFTGEKFEGEGWVNKASLITYQQKDTRITYRRLAEEQEDGFIGESNLGSSRPGGTPSNFLYHGFNNEVQHLGKQKGKCYPKCLWKNTIS